MLSHIQAVIFDMDGVIFDSEQVYYDACFIAAQRQNLHFAPETVQAFAGKSSQTCLLILQAHLQDAEQVQILWHEWGKARQTIIATQGIPMKAGIAKTLQYLAQITLPTALVTSANHRDLTENFSHAPAHLLKQFSPVITVEDVKHPKPHPEPYLLACEQLALSPKDCVVIEDSISGASAALAAGAQTILLNHPDYATELNGHLLFRGETHAEILQFMQHQQLGQSR